MQKGMTLPRGILKASAERLDYNYNKKSIVTIFGTDYEVLFEEAGRFFFLSRFTKKPAEYYLLDSTIDGVEVVEVERPTKKVTKNDIIISWYQKIIREYEKNSYY